MQNEMDFYGHYNEFDYNHDVLDSNVYLYLIMLN